MDSNDRAQIIREHGPYISSSSIPVMPLDDLNINQNVPARKSPPRVHFRGAPSVEDSGPPSPTSGLIPNFGAIAPSIYRSSFPYASNLEHLNNLRLNTLITLVKTPFDFQVTEYIKEAGIKHYRIVVPAHKNGAIIPMESLAQVMKILTNPLNHPVLIHCNKGKHRTGCMTAALRKVANHRALLPWMHPQYITEYQTYAQGKARAADEAFIRALQPKDLLAAIDAIESSPVKPINYNDVTLPTPPTSAESGSGSEESSPLRSAPRKYRSVLREVRQDLEDFRNNYARGLHGAVCSNPDSGDCPLALEHECAAMDDL